jgi:hypothetical protein
MSGGNTGGGCDHWVAAEDFRLDPSDPFPLKARGRWGGGARVTGGRGMVRVQCVVVLALIV